ncbi:uncharacterized protein LOC106879062 isoform X2 [Octopus bimaculoides]|nr:uncharacterized protein LOC106879062 isoform X2 [Octopus bimaculoides]|eukprot:XP_014783976.1 PREDICTED: uncharacterized protein LOC106879062 isoform X2 [Octopus bimaculoides]
MQLLNATRIFLDDYMNKFDILKYKELQPNQKGSIEEWALVSLDNIRKKLEPHVTTSNDRIQLFSDNTGVTDRYTGYRNNLTKQSKPPFIYEPDWMRGRQQPLKKIDTILLEHHAKGLRKHILPIPLIESYYESLGDVPQSYSGDLLATAPGAIKQINPIERMNDAVEKPTGVLGTKLRTGAALLPQLTTRGYLTIDSLYPQETVELHDPLPIFCNDTSESAYSKILRKTDEPLRAYEMETKSLSKEEALKAAQLAAGLEPILSYKSEYKDNFVKPAINRF